MISVKDLYEINYYVTELKNLGLVKSITELHEYSKICTLVIYTDEKYMYYLPDEVVILKEFLIAMTLGYNFILNKYRQVKTLN